MDELSDLVASNTRTSMKRTEMAMHDTDMIREVGTQMKEILGGAGCDHAKTEAMKALGEIFSINHDLYK